MRKYPPPVEPSDFIRDWQNKPSKLKQPVKLGEIGYYLFMVMLFLIVILLIGLFVVDYIVMGVYYFKSLFN